jgi:hypothetical protein
VLVLVSVLHLIPWCVEECNIEMNALAAPTFDQYQRDRATRRQSSEVEDVDGGAVAMDLRRKESHLERTTGERKVNGLEHRLSNELA